MSLLPVLEETYVLFYPLSSLLEKSSRLDLIGTGLWVLQNRRLAVCTYEPICSIGFKRGWFNLCQLEDKEERIFELVVMVKSGGDEYQNDMWNIINDGQPPEPLSYQ